MNTRSLWRAILLCVGMTSVICSTVTCNQIPYSTGIALNASNTTPYKSVSLPENTVNDAGTEEAQTLSPDTSETTEKVSQDTTYFREPATSAVTLNQEENEPLALHEHMFTLVYTINATCIKDGEKIYRCDCGEEKREVLCANGHSFTQVSVTAALCTQPGYIEEKCKCGTTLKTVLPPTGHDFSLTQTVDATESSEGYDIWTCKKCGNSEKRNVKPKLIHIHRYTSSVTEPASCAHTGVKKYVCSCGGTYTEKINKSSHSFTLISTVTPTTSSAGYELWKCSVCGCEEKRNDIPAYPDTSYTDMCTMIDYRYQPHPYVPYNDICQQIFEYRFSDFQNHTLRLIDLGGDYWPLFEWIGWNVPVAIRYGTAYINTESRLFRATVIDEYQKWWDSEIQQMLEEFELENKIIDQLGINEQTTQRHAIELINDWMCQNLYYDYDDRNGSPLIMLKKGGGTCSAYATVFKNLCLLCGICVDYDNGATEATSHAWNKVYFSDGSIYYVDVCWNDAQYIVNGKVVDTCVENGVSAAKVQQLRSRYLLKTYSEFSIDHQNVYYLER